MNKITIRCACMEVYIVDTDAAQSNLYCKCGHLIYLSTKNIMDKNPTEKIKEDQPLDQLLSERGKTHGDFTENSALSRQLRKIILTKLRDRGYQDLPPWMEEGIFMVCHKLARMACGNPAHADHWDDIGGYSKLVSDRLNQEGFSIRPSPNLKRPKKTDDDDLD